MAAAPRDPVLVVNAGSSSLKFGLYARAAGGDAVAVFTGQAEGLEPGGTPCLALRGQAPQPLQAAPGQGAFEAALAALVAWVQAEAPQGPAAVAHRIVHGGERCTSACPLDEATLGHLYTLNPLAPLHQPHNLAGVAAFARALPGVPQIGCFDTAFHATLPEVERRLPLPAAVLAGGVRRYGFHGLSYQHLAQVLGARAPRFAQGRALLAHLGNGASVCGTVAGRSQASSMGFSALDGLMMGTRSGSLDPGVLLHLLAQGWDRARLEQLLYRQSGLKGVSGLSADLRTLRASAEPAAALAIALFTQRLKREAGAIVAALHGIDVLAFTGGIGEHDAALRAALAEALGFLGLRLDAAANAAATGTEVRAIHAAGSAVEAWVVPSDEGRVAAQQAFALLEAARRPATPGSGAPAAARPGPGG